LPTISDEREHDEIRRTLVEHVAASSYGEVGENWTLVTAANSLVTVGTCDADQRDTQVIFSSFNRVKEKYTKNRRTKRVRRLWWGATYVELLPEPTFSCLPLRKPRKPVEKKRSTNKPGHGDQL
jgi:hypothetical protein